MASTEQEAPAKKHTEKKAEMTRNRILTKDLKINTTFLKLHGAMTAYARGGMSPTCDKGCGTCSCFEDQLFTLCCPLGTRSKDVHTFPHTQDHLCLACAATIATKPLQYNTPDLCHCMWPQHDEVCKQCSMSIIPSEYVDEQRRCKPAAVRDRIPCDSFAIDWTPAQTGCDFKSMNLIACTNLSVVIAADDILDTHAPALGVDVMVSPTVCPPISASAVAPGVPPDIGVTEGIAASGSGTDVKMNVAIPVAPPAEPGVASLPQRRCYVVKYHRNDGQTMSYGFCHYGVDPATTDPNLVWLHNMVPHLKVTHKPWLLSAHHIIE